MKITSAALTDVGRVRDGNEDRYLETPPLFGVADGMGGHLAGDVASSTAVEAIARRAQERPPDRPEDLAELVEVANAAINKKAHGDSSLSGMGTTCTLALVKDEHAHLAHVGDSRAYMWRDGKLEQLTQDHTLVNRMVQEGRLQPEEAMRHPQRSIITRALGVDSNVAVDQISVELRDGDRLLLCSDGLTGMVEPDAIQRVLADEAEPEAAARRLIELANEAGGEDNITVVIVDIGGGGRPASERSDSTGAEQAVPEAAEAAAPPAGLQRADTVVSRRAEIADVHREETTGSRRPLRRAWPRRLVVAVLTIAVLGVAAYGAARYALSNSWFVGVSEAGNVTIYQGIPDEIAGLTLKEEEEETALLVEDLPPTFQDSVETGIKVDSLEEARTTVDNLEARARDFLRDTSPRPKRS